MYILHIIYTIRIKFKVIRISKLSIISYLRQKEYRQNHPAHKFGESIFETMPKDASREIEKTPKYFIK